MIAWFIEKANAQPGAEGGEVLPFDAIVIILILIVNAVLGYMQEAKAEAAVEALAQMTAPQTSVLRDGKVMRINTATWSPATSSSLRKAIRSPLMADWSTRPACASPRLH